MKKVFLFFVLNIVFVPTFAQTKPYYKKADLVNVRDNYLRLEYPNGVNKPFSVHLDTLRSWILLGFSPSMNANYVAITGNQSISGIKTFTGDIFAQNIFSNNLISAPNMRLTLGSGVGKTILGDVNGNFSWVNPNRFSKDSVSLSMNYSTGNLTFVRGNKFDLIDLSAKFVKSNGNINYIQKNTGVNLLGNSLLYDNGAGIGIGTVNPGEKIEVVDGNILVNSEDKGIYVGAGGVAFAGLRKINGGGTALIRSDDTFIIGGSSNTNIKSGNLIPQVAINANGSVGIGTTTPTALLDVAGNSKLMGRIEVPVSNELSSNAFFGSSWRYKTSDFATLFTQNESGGFALSSANSGTQNSLISWNRLMTIKNNGNVGIGTANPTEKLEINGSVKISDGSQGIDKILISDANGVGRWQSFPALGYLPLTGGALTGNLNILSNNLGTSPKLSISKNGGDAASTASWNIGIAPYYNNTLSIGNSANEQVLNISQDGRIGINSPSSGAYLDVSGDASIDALILPNNTNGLLKTDVNGNVNSSKLTNSDVSSTANIDASKLNTGVVSNSELNFLDGVTSSIQGQLDSKLTTANANYMPLSGGIFTGLPSVINPTNYNSAFLSAKWGGSGSAIGTITSAEHLDLQQTNYLGVAKWEFQNYIGNVIQTRLAFSGNNIGVNLTNPSERFEVNGNIKSNGAGFFTNGVNKLTTPRNINGVPFDGTADITVVDATAASTYLPKNGIKYVTGITNFSDPIRLTNLANTGNMVKVLNGNELFFEDGVINDIKFLQDSLAKKVNKVNPSSNGTFSHNTTSNLFGTFNSSNNSGGIINFQSSGVNIGHIGSGASNYMSSNASDMVIGNSSTGRVFLGTSNFMRLVVLNNGNVGVGTLAPQAKFEVSGTNGFRYNSGGQGLNKLMQSDATGISSWSDSINVRKLATTGNSYFATTSGNVGIGNTNPLYKLDVIGSGTITQRLYSTNAGTQQIYQGTFGQLYNVSGAFFITNASASSNVEIQTNSTTRMTITSSGNVGIGSSPTEKLSVNGDLGVINGIKAIGQADSFYNGNHVLIDFNSTTEGRIQAYNGNTSTAKPLSLQWNGGNVGVGNSNPTSLFHISGVGQATETAISTNVNQGATLDIQDYGNSPYSGGMIKFSASQGSFAVIKGALKDGTSNTRGDIVFANRNENADVALTTRMIIDYSGKVGIGTVTPSTNLHVVGLPTYADNTTAKAGGLTAGAFYRTAAGVLMVVF